MPNDPDPKRVEKRARGLTADELVAGSDDPAAQAEAILEESDERTEDRESPPGKPVEHGHSDDNVAPVD